MRRDVQAIALVLINLSFPAYTRDKTTSIMKQLCSTLSFPAYARDEVDGDVEREDEAYLLFPAYARDETNSQLPATEVAGLWATYIGFPQFA